MSESSDHHSANTSSLADEFLGSSNKKSTLGGTQNPQFNKYIGESPSSLDDCEISSSFNKMSYLKSSNSTNNQNTLKQSSI